MGRKNLTAVAENPEDADSEMQDADAPPVSHLAARADPHHKGERRESSAAEVTTIFIGRTKAQGCTGGKVHQQDPKGCFTTSLAVMAGTSKGEGAANSSRKGATACSTKVTPLFAVDWSRFTSKDAFLAKTSEVYKLDPNSAEGYNCHVSSYYYVSSDWGVSHPQSYSSVMLKNDSRQSHRWTCVHCRANHPEYADHKTVDEGIVHWWRHHCHPACWTWCDKATAFGVTTAETCKAVIGIDLSDQPLPIGAAFHMLPNALPSHP